MLDPPLPTSDMTGPYVYSLVPIANLHAEVRTGYEARPVTELRMYVHYMHRHKTVVPHS